MRRLFLALKQGWRSFRGPASPPVPYSVTCLCGRVVQGARATRTQTPRCPACKERLFVLAGSAYPPSTDEESPVRPPPPSPRSPWLLPLTAAGVTLVLVAAGLLLIFSHLLRPNVPDNDPRESTSTREIVERGRQLLSDGHFGKALDVLQEGNDCGNNDAELLQLHRQAQLLAKLLDLPLQDIIQKGQNVRNAEAWRKEFRDRYRGWSILFDDWVRRNPNGTFELVYYQVIVGEEKAVVKLDLDLLRRLPLGQPRRLLFGAKLADVSRGNGGVWVIEFEKDSGVLLTEEGAAAALGLAPLDEALREVLREQKRWLAGSS